MDTGVGVKAVNKDAFDKDRFDACFKMAEFRVARHNTRRDYGWKFTFGLWAILIGSIVSPKPELPFPVVGLILFATVLAHGYFWIGPIALRNRRDIKAAFYFADLAGEMLGEPRLTTEIPTMIREMTTRDRLTVPFRKDVWETRFPFAVSAALALIVFLTWPGATDWLETLI